jgi:phospholipid/cholesterol/gamma-HCH transport system permease protein
MVIEFINYIGKKTFAILDILGGFVLFLLKIIGTTFTTRLKFTQLLLQIDQIGVGSFSIIFLTGASTGLALALQTYIGLNRFGAHEFIGVIVALGMTRELGPVMTGLMVAGRSGSGMAAEVGTMQITEQIDALRTLSINPFQYLIVPRIIASVFVLPLLAVFSMLCGIAGGYLYAVYVLEIPADMYINSITKYLELKDITGGLFKASMFGLILSWVGTYNGYRTTGGARGVGMATTRTVVVSSIMILIANYLLSSFLFKTGVA